MSNDNNWYGSVFKNWQTKLLGPKPTSEQLAAIHGLKAKPGKQAMACAMALRDCGVTNAQIVMVCGNPQLNKMRGFITDALLRRLPTSNSSEGHTVYKLEVTPKGRQRIARTEAGNAKLDAEGKGEATEKQPAKRPSKAKGTAKASRKAKAKPDAKPASEPANAADQYPTADQHDDGTPIEQVPTQSNT